MERTPNIGEHAKARSPEEELARLREEVARRERELTERGEHADHERVARERVDAYKQTAPEAVLEPDQRLSSTERDAIVLDLAPEEHDEKVADLLGLVQEKGVKNALSVAEQMGAHIEDDFHRALVQYIKEGYPAKGVKEGQPLWRSLSLVLFEVAVPTADEDGQEKQLKEILSAMEQFYSGLLAVSSSKEFKKEYFTVEIAVSEDSESVIFYAAVPRAKKDSFEKQVLAVFPRAHVTERANDYNVFNPDGATAGARGALARHPAYPFRSYDEFDHDPLNIVLSAFARLAKDGEGAAIQIAISPVGDYYTKPYKRALDSIRQGTPPEKALKSGSLFAEIGTGLVEELFGGITGGGSDSDEERVADEIALEEIGKKVKSPIVATNIRLVTSAADRKRAEAILAEIIGTFQQFESPQGNALSFRQVSGRDLKQLIKEFTFRRFSTKAVVPLALFELTSLFHFSAGQHASSRELKQSKAKTAPAPVDMPESGVLLGVNRYGGQETPVHFSPDDRMRHLYVIGQTGTGKTTLLKNAIKQDIENGEGVCMIDPHGADITDVLSYVPRERWDDVIYVDPSHTEHPIALNMLEYDPARPEQKTFAANELLNIFSKLYADTPEGLGPMFQQYFRNAVLLTMEDPASGSTLLDVPRVLSDANYRRFKLERSNNHVVNQFWRDIAEKAGDESALENIVPYITSKTDAFLANEIMRPILAQQKSSFDFRRVMDERKILLVNLSKGRLGDVNANLIGLIIVGKILMAALSREVSSETPPFYLYIDEFQNVTTDSISTILSEARKYKLSLSVAHQFIAQLDDAIRDAVFGNVGSMAAFRVGTEDAKALEPQFSPTFSATDLMNLDNRQAVMRLLVDGRPATPFSLATLPSTDADRARADELIQYSHARWGRPRAEVEAQINKRFTPPPPSGFDE